MIHTLSAWFSNPWLAGALVAFSVLAILASILLVPRFLAKLPQDYLHGQKPEQAHSLAHKVSRNALGVVLVLLGVAMLLLPGQGLLTLLVGLLLVDFPGRHRLVVWLLAKPKVLAVVNKLRLHHGSPPLHA
jgi:Na+/H+ antiporter NhaD/arsenite permease-like protein